MPDTTLPAHNLGCAESLEDPPPADCVAASKPQLVTLAVLRLLLRGSGCRKAKPDMLPCLLRVMNQAQSRMLVTIAVKRAMLLFHACRRDLD
jgi:hypothetical protein